MQQPSARMSCILWVAFSRHCLNGRCQHHVEHLATVDLGYFQA